MCQVVGNLPCKFVASWVLHLAILRSAMRDWWQLPHLAVPSIYGARFSGVPGWERDRSDPGTVRDSFLMVKRNPKQTHLKMLFNSRYSLATSTDYIAGIFEPSTQGFRHRFAALFWWFFDSFHFLAPTLVILVGWDEDVFVLFLFFLFFFLK